MIWCASDIHLRPGNHRNNQLFYEWLNQLGQSYPAELLILLGDIFDLWVGSHEAWSKVYPREVEALTACAERGIQVIYLQGNHDVAAEQFWRKRGVVFSRGDYQLQWQGKTFFLTHGDFINPNEKAYHLYIRWLQGNGANQLAQILPQSVWSFIGNRLSRMSRKKSDHLRQSSMQQFERWFEQFSKMKYQQNPYDYCLSGHIHLRLKLALSPHSWAINLGSWFEPHPCVLQISSAGPYFVELEKLLSPA